MNLKNIQEKVRNDKLIWKLEGTKQMDRIIELSFLSTRKEILKIVKKWRKTACFGLPNCSIDSCDLCSNCFDKLIQRLK